jgi:hypothetical protein
MNKQLLIDVMSFEPQRDVLMESIKNIASGRPFIVKGILQRAEIKNQNGRIYPKSTLMREVQKYNDEFVKERRALGECDHPNSEIVNLKNASHNVVELHWEGNDLIGTIEILPTPSGNILKSLFEANIRLGVSSRAMGSLKKISENAEMVNDDLSLVCFDYVSNPSVRGAFTFPSDQQTLSEGTIVKNPITNKWEQVETIIQDIFNEII